MCWFLCSLWISYIQRKRQKQKQKKKYKFKNICDNKKKKIKREKQWYWTGGCAIEELWNLDDDISEDKYQAVVNLDFEQSLEKTINQRIPPPEEITNNPKKRNKRSKRNRKPRKECNIMDYIDRGLWCFVYFCVYLCVCVCVCVWLCDALSFQSKKITKHIN